MLTSLNVRGYKALRDISTTFEPLTVLVGPNGCGKSSVLESISMVQDFESKGIEDASQRHSIEELGSKDMAPDAELSIELHARLAMSARDQLEAEVPFVLMGVPSKKRWTKQTANPRHEALAQRPFESCVGRIRRLALDSRILARPSYLSEIAPQLGDDGSGLASVLSTLAGEQREVFEAIQDQLRELVPEIERIRLRPTSVAIAESQEGPVAFDDAGREILAKRSYQRSVIGNEVFFDYRHAKSVRAKHASEGTLLLLGLLTVALAEDVSVMLLDDVDRALHPKAQQQLVAYLRKLYERGIQVIATSYSPYLVLHLEYEEVRAMTMSDSGGALIGKLTEHPEYERWREDMTPSEFWTVFGEEWLAR